MKLKTKNPKKKNRWVRVRSRLNKIDLLAVVLGFAALGYFVLSLFARGDITIYLSPSSVGAGQSEQFQTQLRISSGGGAVRSFAVTLSFDDKISYAGASFGSAYNNSSVQQLSSTQIRVSGDPNPDPSGDNLVATLTFNAQSAGNGQVSLSNADLNTHPGSASVDPQLSGMTYSISSPPPPPPPSPSPPPPSPQPAPGAGGGSSTKPLAVRVTPTAPAPSVETNPASPTAPTVPVEDITDENSLTPSVGGATGSDTKSRGHLGLVLIIGLILAVIATTIILFVRKRRADKSYIKPEVLAPVTAPIYPRNLTINTRAAAIYPDAKKGAMSRPPARDQKSAPTPADLLGPEPHPSLSQLVKIPPVPKTPGAKAKADEPPDIYQLAKQHPEQYGLIDIKPPAPPKKPDQDQQPESKS